MQLAARRFIPEPCAVHITQNGAPRRRVSSDEAEQKYIQSSDFHVLQLHKGPNTAEMCWEHRILIAPTASDN